MSLLNPLEAAGSWLLVTLHRLLAAPGLPDAHGVTWWLALAGLVIAVRLMLLPLAIRQWRTQRALSQLRPRLEALRRRHQHSRTAQQEALASLLREHRISPLATLAPLLLQAPVVWALYRILNGLSHGHLVGVFTSHPAAAASASAAALLGVHLSSTLRVPGPSGAALLSRLLIVAVLLATAALTYLSQRVGSGEVPPAVMTLLPTAGVLVFGCLVPFGILTYWLVNTSFLFGQQRLLRRLARE
jgi:YidC/Oxa1 family membrane protein insertase